MPKYRVKIDITWFLEAESKNTETGYNEVRDYFKRNHNMNLQRNEVSFEPIPAEQKEEIVNPQGAENGTQIGNDQGAVS